MENNKVTDYSYGTKITNLITALYQIENSESKEELYDSFQELGYFGEFDEAFNLKTIADVKKWCQHVIANLEIEDLIDVSRAFDIKKLLKYDI